MLEENQAILKTGLDVIKKEADTIERVVLKPSVITVKLWFLK